MKRTASIVAIVIGALLIVGGVATWIVVASTLADQKIVVSDDASCLAGDEVDGPFSAYCQAKVIEKHALEATGGLYYAELTARTRCGRRHRTQPSCRHRCSPRWWPSASPGWRCWWCAVHPDRPRNQGRQRAAPQKPDTHGLSPPAILAAVPATLRR